MFYGFIHCRQAWQWLFKLPIVIGSGQWQLIDSIHAFSLMEVKIACIFQTTVHYA